MEKGKWKTGKVAASGRRLSKMRSRVHSSDTKTPMRHHTDCYSTHGWEAEDEAFGPLNALTAKLTTRSKRYK